MVQGFQTPAYATQFGHLYTYGMVRGKLNFGTDEWPILITDGTENAGSQDHYFGRFSDKCKPIADSTLYPKEEVQCGVLVMEREVDIRGSGLKMRWVNERKSRKMVDAEWFDSPRGIQQFIRGATSDFFRYQWDVQKGAIEGVYKVEVKDACGDSFISKPIILKSYGEPTVHSTTIVRDYIVGDTFKMWAVPDTNFEAMKYAWVKGEFFMFDWGPIKGTADTAFSINGLTGDHSGIYRLVSYPPQCPDYFFESLPYPLLVNTSDTVNKDWQLNAKQMDRILENIYPNPVEDELHLNFSNFPYSGDLAIYDIKGRCIEKRTFSPEDLKINSRLWKPGVYMLKLQIHDQLLIRKLIKLN